MSNWFGGSSSVETSAVEDLEEDEATAKKGRSALLATAGGLLGEEVQAGDTTKRNTLFGN